MDKFFKIFVLIFFGFFYLYPTNTFGDNKIKIGLLVPITGNDKELGNQIIKSTRIALRDINTQDFEIFIKDTNSNPDTTINSAKEFKEMGIKIVIGPVFYKSLTYLSEVEEITFLSFTNKTIGLPKNIISAGINATSQLRTIKKFIKLNDIKKTYFLTPMLDYENEINTAIKKSKINISKKYIYNTEPTKLTSQIEKITNYKIRKQNLEDEIRRVENSDLADKERQLEKLEKKYTIGKVNFDSVIIADFDESLKSVITSLLYTDVSPKNKFIITFNQWFDESLLIESASQPIYYPSINRENLKNFEKKFFEQFNETPNHLSLLSYDLVGLVYYLSLKNKVSEINKVFKAKNSFKGKIGIFEIENNICNHHFTHHRLGGAWFKAHINIRQSCALVIIDGAGIKYIK